MFHPRLGRNNRQIERRLMAPESGVSRARPTLTLNHLRITKIHLAFTQLRYATTSGGYARCHFYWPIACGIF